MQEKKMTGFPSIDKPWLRYYDSSLLNADIPRMSIYDYVYENNKANLNDTVFVYYERHISYREFFNMIDTIAKALLAEGVKEGDIVAIGMPSTPEAYCTMYAINKIGAESDILDVFFAGPEMIKHYLEETNTDFFVITDIILEKIRPIISEINLKRIIIKQDIYCEIPKMDTFVKWNDFLDNSFDGVDSFLSHYNKMEYSVIEHTGGTTGSPKGAMLSDDGLNGQVWQLANALGFKRGEVWLGLMPIFSSFGLMGGHLAISEGLISVLVPNFVPEDFPELICKCKPNRFAVSPAFWEILLNYNELDTLDLSNIINPIVGGDVVNVKTENKINELFERKGNPSVLIKGYSCTEASAGTTCNLNKAVNRVGSVGVPLPKVEVKIVDPDTLEEKPYNEHGEICVGGSNLMVGYYNRPEETANAMRTHSDNKVWLHTGDIGYMDEDGFLFITNRIKRIIIRNDGCKVYPSTIETRMYILKSASRLIYVAVKSRKGLIRFVV